MSKKALPATPTMNTVQLVAQALNTISNDVDREAGTHPLVVEQSNGVLKEVTIRATRPQAAFDVVRTALDAAKSNQDIKDFVYGLTVVDAHFKANESEIKAHCWIALALCRNCEALISENRLGEALDAALDAREYAAVAYYLAVPESVRLPHLVKIHMAETGRENAKKNRQHRNCDEFIVWAKSQIKYGEKPRNVEAIKLLSGFNKEWAETDQTIKDWWNGIADAPKLKPGRTPKIKLRL